MNSLHLYKISNDNKHGYINAKGDIIVDTDYSFATQFNENLAIVGQNSEFHLIDKNGHKRGVLVDGTPDIDGFSFRRAAVSVDDKWGYCDEYGQLVIYPRFESARTFDKWGAIVCDRPQSWGRIDSDGRWQSKDRFRFVWPFAGDDPYTGAQMQNGRWVVIDSTGAQAFGGQFSQVMQAAEGLIPVKYDDRLKQSYGWIDLKGNEVVGPVFDRLCNHFCNGLIPAQLGEHWGLVDVRGNWVVGPKYATLCDGSAGRWPFVLKDDDELYGIIDREGKVVAEQKFTFPMKFHNELAWVEYLKDNEPYKGYIDPSARMVWRQTLR